MTVVDPSCSISRLQGSEWFIRQTWIKLHVTYGCDFIFRLSTAAAEHDFTVRLRVWQQIEQHTALCRHTLTKLTHTRWPKGPTNTATTRQQGGRHTHTHTHTHTDGLTGLTGRRGASNSWGYKLILIDFCTHTHIQEHTDWTRTHTDTPWP